MSTPDAPLEIEAKFALDDPVRGDALAAAASLGGGIQLGVVTEKVDRDTYADTADLALLRAGWALRHRARGVTGADGRPVVKHLVTLKALASDRTAATGHENTGHENTAHATIEHAGAVHARAEYEGPLNGAPLDTAAWPEAVRRAASDACGGPIPTLSPLFTLAQRRRVRAVRVDGAVVGELSIDAVSVHLADGADGADGSTQAVARFDEVEFELAPGADTALLARIVPALAAASGGQASGGSKFDRAVSLLATASAVGDLPAAARARLFAALAELGARRTGG